MHDLKRAQQQVGEKARAHVKFDHLSNKRKRGNDQASVPNPNYQLIGALSSQSSSSPAIANAAVIRPADPGTSALAESAGGSPAIVILEKEHSGTRIVLPTTRESRSSKRRKRAKGTKIPDLKVCPQSVRPILDSSSYTKRARNSVKSFSSCTMAASRCVQHTASDVRANIHATTKKRRLSVRQEEQ